METETKQCQSCHTEFKIDLADLSFYAKINVPAPTWCPRCRLKRRLAFRNERSLYKRDCDLCHESMLSVYSPKSPYIVYCAKCWHSDAWDQYSYGREYDFSRPFLEQFIELEKSIPRLTLLQENNIDSPWVNYETDDKNCYLNFGGHLNEDSAYNQYALKSKDSLDNFWMIHGEYSYENILCENSYKSIGSIFCYESQEILFSFDCRNCSNVIGCSGLRHKQYYIFNKQVSKEEYKQFVDMYICGSREKFDDLQAQAHAFWKQVPQRALFIERSVDCTGNLIKDSKNCHDAWNVEKSENISHAMFNLELKDSQDVISVWQGELSYEVMAAFLFSNVMFSSNILSSSSNIQYSNMMFASNNCFGCSHLKKGEYAILNKRYSKQEYLKLMPKIVEHMKEQLFTDRNGRVFGYGEFFPYEVSPFNYDETIANEYFPLDDEAMKKEGVNQYDHAVETHYDLDIYTVPDSLNDVDDSVTQKAIICEETGKPFKIIPLELAFYRRFNLPLPTRSPFSRHYKRLRFVADHLSLRSRICSNCKKDIQSVYSEQEFPIVYCEQCYQKEML